MDILLSKTNIWCDRGSNKFRFQLCKYMFNRHIGFMNDVHPS